MTARRTKFMKDSGPYRVLSCANGDLKVVPAWKQFPPWNKVDGGGPCLFSRLRLVADVEDFMNVATQNEKSRACDPAPDSTLPAKKG